jgi:hypothetical protein
LASSMVSMKGSKNIKRIKGILDGPWSDELMIRRVDGEFS